MRRLIAGIFGAIVCLAVMGIGMDARRGAIFAQSDDPPLAGMILARQPATLYTDQNNPVSVERILVRMPAQRNALARSNSLAAGDFEDFVTFSVFRLSGRAGELHTPIYLLPDWSPQGDAAGRMTTDLLRLAAALGPDADMYIVEPRGLVGPDTDFSCPGNFVAPLSRTVGREEMGRLAGAFLADCLAWWQEAGMDPGVYSFSAMAEDLIDTAALLGHEEIAVAGVGMGAFVGLYAAQHEATPLAQAILIRPPGISYPFTRPDGLHELIGTLGRRAAVAPTLFGLVPDLDGLVHRVAAQLDLTPVAVTVTDLQTGRAEVVSVGIEDLQMTIGEVLAAGQADLVPALLFEMAQGDFRELGERTLERRRYSAFDLAAVSALCRAAPDAEERARWATAAAVSPLGWGPFQLLGEACGPFVESVLVDGVEPDLIGFERIELPLLFVTGDLDGRASALEINTIATEHLNIEDLLIQNWVGRMEGDFWREAGPVMHTFLEDDFEAIPLASTSLSFQRLTARPFQLSPWQADYYANRNLTGDPVLNRIDPVIDFSWGADSPDPAVPGENFSVRWSQQVELPAGGYRFYLWSDDGARLWIDNVLVLDAWQEGPLRAYVVDVNLVAGLHDIRYEYFDAGGNALARLRVSYIHTYPDWLATYYPNVDLAGEPVVVRNEQTPNVFWGNNAPAPSVPAGNFSARWATDIQLEPGSYAFRILANGGVRFYVDDELVIDAWENVGRRLLEANRILDGIEATRLRVEYFGLGTATELSVRWLRRPAPLGPDITVSGQTRVETDASVAMTAETVPEGDREVVSIFWDMGDSVQYSGPAIEHTYAAPGIYDITVVVTDSGGIANGISRQMRVDNAPLDAPSSQPPLASWEGPTVLDAGSLASFDAGESLGLNPIVSYRWEFGDGSRSHAAWVQKVYQTPGLYNVRLRIEDDQGNRASHNRLVLVLPSTLETPPTLSGPVPNLDFETPPTAAPDAPTPPGEDDPVAIIIGTIGEQSILFDVTEAGELTVDLAANQSIVLDGRSSTTQEDTPLTAIEWDIADGFSTTTDPVIELVFAAPGQYRVQLTVTDAAERTARTGLNINVFE